jgi:hypothetical protein
MGTKKAGYLHRTATTAYPCYLPVLGEFSRSWPYKTCRGKYTEERSKEQGIKNAELLKAMRNVYLTAVKCIREEIPREIKFS